MHASIAPKIRRMNDRDEASEKSKLLMAFRQAGDDWIINNVYSLRGYRGCQNNLEPRERQYGVNTK